MKHKLGLRLRLRLPLPKAKQINIYSASTLGGGLETGAASKVLPSYCPWLVSVGVAQTNCRSLQQRFQNHLSQKKTSPKRASGRGTWWLEMKLQKGCLVKSSAPYK